MAEELPGGEYGVWVVMEKLSPRLPSSEFFQPSLGASRAAKASVFENLPMKKYSLQRWAAIFQVIEAEASKNPTLCPEGMKREKVEDQKPAHQPLILVETIPENIRVEDGLVMTSCIRAWYHMYEE